MKFSLAEDGRPVLAAEIPAERLDLDELGLGLARVLAVSDVLADESAGWLTSGTGGRPAPTTYPAVPGVGLLERYAERLGDLAAGAVSEPAPG